MAKNRKQDRDAMKFMAHIKERARTNLDPKLYDNDIIQFRSQE